MVRSERHSMGAFLLIGLGVLFLIGQVFNINFWSMMGFSWPAFVLIPGVIFLALAATGTRKSAGFVFPGAIITGTGAILWYQEITGNWQSWAYMWTLYPAFVGAAMMFFGRRTDDDKTYGVGHAMVNYSVIAFLAFAAFFELFIFHANGALFGWMIPVGLIALGAFLLFGGRGSGEKRKFGGGHRFRDGFFPQPQHNGYIPRDSHSNDLQQRIDEALAEKDPVEPRDPQSFV